MSTAENNCPPLTLHLDMQLVAKIFPAQQAVNKVVEKAERFWEENPSQYIGIHCAYGKLISWICAFRTDGAQSYLAC